MGNNKLKLNPDKTEFIVIGDDQIRSSLKSSFPVSLLGNTMEPAESVKNLGVILDAENSNTVMLNTVMLNLSCTNYTGSPFITVYCSNIISSFIKQYI